MELCEHQQGLGQRAEPVKETKQEQPGKAETNRENRSQGWTVFREERAAKLHTNGGLAYQEGN